MPALYESDQVLKIPAYMDKLFNIEVKDAPMLKLLPRGPNPGNMLTHWGVEAYARRAIVGAVDGTDVSSYSSVDATEVEMYAQWSVSAGWQVGKLAAVTNTAGTPAKRQKARQIMHDAIAFKLALNRLVLSAQECAVESKPSQGYQTRGMFQWLSRSAQAVKPVNASFRPASGCAYTDSLASYASSSLKTQLEAAYAAKGGPVDLDYFVGVSLKGAMSGWAEKRSVSSDETVRMFNQDASSKTMINVVDVFDFDAGTVRAILTPDLRCDLTTGRTTAYTVNSGIGVDLSMWELCFLEDVTPFEQPDLGGGPRGYHSAICIVKCLNPLGQIVTEISS